MSKELIEHDDSRPKITGSPETIWLNYGDLERDDTHQNCAALGEVTWCGEAVFVSDVKYVKADRIEELEREHDAFYMEYRMKCDEETKALQADNARLREALEHSVLYVPDLATVPGIATALATPPKQSLARIRNQVRDECAQILEKQDVAPSFKHRMADAIRARGDTK